MSNEIKQTSVEQLFHKLWDTPKDKFTWYAILKEHMAMHKEEIEDAYWEGGIDVPANGERCQQYYNETYRDDKQ
jgi:hypothetical protein